MTMASRHLPLGQTFITPNAVATLEQSDVAAALGRHSACDWGECTEADRMANDQALSEGTRVFSVYHSKRGEKFWIITEADRSYTTVLMPEDY